ncbi:MAG: DUF1553 domain-containing protein [Verrucomicrobia bacterium]|nr:DUF1553 domain-containing protein [Verrucomicrobiota bacterium]
MPLPGPFPRLATLYALPLAIAAAPAPVDFSREIQPILSDACFRCHGPDESKREARLRLDTKEGLYRTREDVTVVKPGAPADSELVFRISSKDPDEIMPPPDAVPRLKPAEIALIRRWVAEGAKWSAHWSFAPIVAAKPPTPPAGDAEAVRRRDGETERKGNDAVGSSLPLSLAPSLRLPKHPIDAFVLAKLSEHQLAPAPEADRERLIRRVSLDLTGLPPTPAKIDAFLTDPSSRAYEKVVDRLLASPRFGERMAAEWLDVARFADTHGYQMDRPRAMWAYRDWVIKAINENLPFDQFATWQLAGDLLPNATKEQRLATAFNRLHNQNEEGGVVEEEYRVAYVADRVATFGTAFLGLTLECCRCHDHKFDPITQRDYYSLFAFFQNIDEAGQISYKGFADAMPVPTLLLTTDEQDRQLAGLRAKTAAAEKNLVRRRADSSAAFAVWLESKVAAPGSPSGLVAEFPLDAIVDGKVANTVDAAKPGRAQESPRLVDTARGPAAELDGENGFTFPDVGHFKRTDPFTLSVWLQTPAPPAPPPPRTVVIHHSKAPADAGSRGYELLLENGRVAFGLHFLWPGASLKVVTKTAVPAGEWVHLTATYDGSSRAAGARVFIDGRATDLEVVRDGLSKDITYTGKEPDLTIGFRFRDSGFKGGRVREFRIFDRALTPLESAQLAGRIDLADAWNLAPAQLSSAQREGLFEYFVALIHAPTRDAMLALRAAREEQNALVTPLPEAMVMEELPHPKPAFVLERGAYDAPGAPVTADTPPALPPLPAGAPRNRLGLARWLTDPANPLLARVTVNRFWQMMFGLGLVATADNFGLQGSPPTHPGLLDWLAHDFVANNWDVKRALRQIALSATYRQSSRATPGLLARDPQNLLLARGPARRLTAEMLRDQALAASGLLVEIIGGPSVKPYQPPGLWEEIAMGKPKYEQGRGADLHRRSLYTFWKRTVPPPTMTLFDAAERNICTVQRQSTSTPLQALALLNDVQMVEAARLIGQRMLLEGGATSDARLAWAFRLVTGRRADERERAILHELYAEQREFFAADAAAAEQFNALGETATDTALSAADRAASAVVAKALLNFDEAVMRR